MILIFAQRSIHDPPNSRPLPRPLSLTAPPSLTVPPSRSLPPTVDALTHKQTNVHVTMSTYPRSIAYQCWERHPQHAPYENVYMYAHCTVHVHSGPGHLEMI